MYSTNKAMINTKEVLKGRKRKSKRAQVEIHTAEQMTVSVVL